MAMELFLEERHHGTLTLVGPDGRPHVTPVGFGWDRQAGLVRIITVGGSRKAALLTAGPLPAAVCQVDGSRWATIEGFASVSDDPGRVAAAVAAYTARYEAPRARSGRVAIEITPTRLRGRA
ncbi:MAG: TIGR03618 family F420-dependent PPOX class oxidoreductase [Actinomycetia bacterium]|nr:TIGR03618 family F420-dependent PPOX class oxidoreductase [Actinomycetes bacterium]